MRFTHSIYAESDGIIGMLKRKLKHIHIYYICIYGKPYLRYICSFCCCCCKRWGKKRLYRKYLRRIRDACGKDMHMAFGYMDALNKIDGLTQCLVNILVTILQDNNIKHKVDDATTPSAVPFRRRQASRLRLRFVCLRSCCVSFLKYFSACIAYTTFIYIII